MPKWKVCRDSRRALVTMKLFSRQHSSSRFTEKRVVLALMVSLCLPGAQAALLLYDGFDYPVKEQLGEAN